MGALIYLVSVICSAAIILFSHHLNPKPGATVGASGGVFGLLGAALIISYRRRSDSTWKRWLWIALAVGFGVSLLPGISMSGHIGGIIGGVLIALLIKLPRDES